MNKGIWVVFVAAAFVVGTLASTNVAEAKNENNDPVAAAIDRLTEVIENTAVQGAQGEQGPQGPEGPGCSIQDTQDGALIQCGNTQQELLDGQSNPDVRAVSWVGKQIVAPDGENALEDVVDCNKDNCAGYINGRVSLDDDDSTVILRCFLSGGGGNTAFRLDIDQFGSFAHDFSCSGRIYVEVIDDDSDDSDDTTATFHLNAQWTETDNVEVNP